MRFYKVYKFLFEEDKYKSISLVSKFAYCVYLDMMRQKINTKVDSKEKEYIENSRDYLMEKLNISINTVTKINKELKSVELLSDAWEDVGKPKILYVKNCESYEPKVIHKICETPKVEETPAKIETKSVEIVPEIKVEKVPDKKIEYIDQFTEKDIEEAEKLLNSLKNRFINLDSKRILRNIQFRRLGINEIKLVRLAIEILTRVYKEDVRYENIFRLTDELLYRAVRRCQMRERDGRCVAYILGDCILQTIIDSMIYDY